MIGKIVLITGANAGIGKETARALAAKGATVVMVCRDKAKGEAARDEIVKDTGNKDVDLFIADLSSLQAVRKVAAEFKAKYKQLHVLVNNAGAINSERSTTVDGLERTFATNHLSYFILTNLLLDVLKASAPARVVNVASEAHKSGVIDFTDLNWEKRPFVGFVVYGTSKLMNILFTFELARRLEGTQVTANCLHPGVIGSNFGKNTQGYYRMLIRLANPFLTSSEKGAETSVYLASSPDVEGVTGKYFAKKKVKSPRKLAHNREIAKKLWEVSEQLCNSAKV